MTDEELDKGWDIFHADGKGKQIQRIDEAGVFETDADAIRHVIKRANQGDKRSQDALAETIQTDDLVRQLLKEAEE